MDVNFGINIIEDNIENNHFQGKVIRVGYSFLFYDTVSLTVSSH